MFKPGVAFKRCFIWVLALTPAMLSILASIPFFAEFASTGISPAGLLSARPQLLVAYVCVSMTASHADVIILVLLEVFLRLLCGLLVLAFLWNTPSKYGVLRLMTGAISLYTLMYCFGAYLAVRLLVATSCSALLAVFVICVAANAYLLARAIRLSDWRSPRSDG